MLTTRELATIVWFALASALIWWRLPSIREPIRSLVATILQPVFLIPAALFTVWMLVAVCGAAYLGMWTLARLKDTLFWLVPGFILLFGAVKVATEQGFFRQRVRDAIGLSALLVFYLNVAMLDIAWGLILVPLLTLLGVVAAFGNANLGSTPAVSARAGSRARFIAGLIVIGLVVYTTIRLVQNADTTDWVDLASSLALPAWLTLWALPFVWAVSVYLEYDAALARMRISTTDRRLPRKSVLALVASFRFRRTALHRFAGRWQRELATARGFREARAVIAKQQDAVHAEAAAQQKATDDLERYAGVPGLDQRGRQLDKREFKETVEALDLLASSQMGWYRNGKNRYHADLLVKLGDVFRGDLPIDHGIAMKVSRSGQSWYAWRQAPSGLTFAVGAAGPPPDQRFYEGMATPRGFPHVSPGWLPPHEHGPNWEWVYDPDDSWYEEVEPATDPAANEETGPEAGPRSVSTGADTRI